MKAEEKPGWPDSLTYSKAISHSPSQFPGGVSGKGHGVPGTHSK